MIHSVKGFSVVNQAEVDIFLKLSCIFDDPMDVGSWITGSSGFSKSEHLEVRGSHTVEAWLGKF